MNVCFVYGSVLKWNCKSCDQACDLCFKSIQHSPSNIDIMHKTYIEKLVFIGYGEALGYMSVAVGIPKLYTFYHMNIILSCIKAIYGFELCEKPQYSWTEHEYCGLCVSTIFPGEHILAQLFWLCFFSVISSLLYWGKDLNRHQYHCEEACLQGHHYPSTKTSLFTSLTMKTYCIIIVPIVTAETRESIF